MMTDLDLYRRGTDTMLAAWGEYARAAKSAALERLPGVAVAVFPSGPEREFYNNALLSPGAPAAAVDAMEAVYAEAGVTAFAAWTHESDPVVRAELERRGYVLDTTTRAMGLALDEIRVPRPELPFGPASWADYLAYEGLDPDFLRDGDHAALHVLAAREQGAILSAALAYDAAGDCGIYNVGTVEAARRRGLGTAITAAQVHQARDRGCTTASLQSTPMAERVYAAVGFRDLGRILEYVRR
ncbi:MAG TPA: GNAT family N-acetyltransferase [Mycobacteriales bacterium]|nr:GNAT family N-acetyltransferase [Mycobacteriales bacterium]